MTFSITTLGIMILSITTLGIISLSLTTLVIMTLSIMVESSWPHPHVKDKARKARLTGSNQGTLIERKAQYT
jgi:hypothetical protein